MNRAERRRAVKQEASIARKVSKWQNQETLEAVTLTVQHAEAVLREQFGFGDKRIQKFFSAMMGEVPK